MINHLFADLLYIFYQIIIHEFIIIIVTLIILAYVRISFY